MTAPCVCVSPEMSIFDSNLPLRWDQGAYRSLFALPHIKIEKEGGEVPLQDIKK